MRVISGILGGRRLKAPRGTLTRPTSDRVREGLFSRLESLGPEVLQGASVLDVYAGSGALGIEAASRGADHVTFIESDPGAVAVIDSNCAALGIGDEVSVLRGDVRRIAAEGRMPGVPFALLFLDPPYRINKSEVRGVIEVLTANDCLDSDSLVVWEHAAGEEAEWPEGFESLGVRSYGDTAVDVARRRGE